MAGGRARRLREPRRSWPVVALATVVGILVGGVIGIAWARGGSGGTAAPVEIGLDVLPPTVLGQQRDDLASEAMGGATATAGKRMAQQWVSEIPEYETAYGGPGIQGSYGNLDNTSYQLLIVNGIQPTPVAGTDVTADRLGVIGPGFFVAATGTTETRCAVNPASSIPIDDGTTAAAARGRVLDDPAAAVICVRSDRDRNLSVQIETFGGADESAAQRAGRVAAEVDRIWGDLIR